MASAPTNQELFGTDSDSDDDVVASTSAEAHADDTNGSAVQQEAAATGGTITSRDMFGESDSDDEVVAATESAGAAAAAAAQSTAGELAMAPAATGVPSRKPATDAAEAAAAAARRAAAAPLYLPCRPATQRPLPQQKATILPLPRTIALARQGFSADTFNGAAEAAQFRAQGKLLGADTATVRWRWADDAKTAKVTNTKMVKWSDGSTTLHVGEDVFEISASQLLADCELLFAGTQAAEVDGQGKAETVLEAIAPVSRRLQMRPLSGNTATRAVLLARQGTLREGIKVIQTARDGESLMAKRIKVAEDALAAQSKAAAREAALAARATRGGRVGDMDEAFLESSEGLQFDDAAEGVSLKELKKSVRSGARDAELFAAESDSGSGSGSGGEEAAAGDEESDDASDGEEEGGATATAGSAAATAAAAQVSDSESEDEDFDPSKPAAGGGSGSDGGGDDDDDDEDDDLFDDDDEAPAAAAEAPVGGAKRVSRAPAVADSSDEEEAPAPASKKPRAGGTVLDGDDSDSD